MKELFKTVKMRGQTLHNSKRFKSYSILKVRDCDDFSSHFRTFYERIITTFWHQINIFRKKKKNNTNKKDNN